MFIYRDKHSLQKAVIVLWIKFLTLWVTRGLYGPIDERAIMGKFDLRVELCDLNYPTIHVHFAYNCKFGGFRGHGGLQMASEVRSDLGIKVYSVQPQ